ncbi:porin [Vibrio fluvialis]|nr:porin [Vibrio fluvialis]MBY7974629.1 porin [Vibrio fluvialis]MBY7996602.1 porin [Vibrio fluvialis]MBY8103863.1 porin [Vibrio fluvialis]
MKKTLLALAVISAASSVNAAEILKSDAGSVDFYGQLRTEMKFMDSKDYNADLTTGSSRIGVSADYKAVEGFNVLGLVEVGVPANDSNDVTVRRHLVGFATDFGTIKFGRDWTTSDDIGGTDYSYFFGGTGNRYSTLNGALNTSQIKYSLDLDNAWVKASYGLNDSNQDQDLAELFAGTSFGDVALHAGVGKNRNHDVKDTNSAGGTSTSYGDISNTFYELTAVYSATDSLELSATYYGAKLKNEAGAGKIDENAISLGAYWTFAEKTSLYAGYEFVKQEAKDILANADEDGTNVFAGLEYKFGSFARVFAEAGFSDGTTLGFTTKDNVLVGPTKVDSETNFGIGARVYW